MDVLATYEQRFAGVRRQFALLPDCLTVHGRKLGSTFDVRYDLGLLSAQSDHARVFAPLFYGGLVLIGSSLLSTMILAFNDGLILPGLVVVGVIALTGIACIMLRPRRLEVFMFKLKDGNFAFEIIGAGPDAARVRQFASSLAEQIQKTRGEAKPL